MWNPTFIHFKNLMSHSDTRIDFLHNKTLLIYGKNFDEEGEPDSNGSGKSVIIESLNLAFFGEVYRPLNKEKFIRRGEKLCSVEFELENKFLGLKLKIVREFRTGKTAKAFIYENGVSNDEINGLGIDAVNNRFIELIGISKEDLLYYFIVNQKSDNSFFTAGDAQKKKIISRFIDVKIVEEAKGLVELDLNEKQEEIDELTNQIFSKQERVSLFEEQLVEEKAAAEDNVTTELTKLSGDIAVYQLQQKQCRTNIQNLNKKIDAVNIQITDMRKGLDIDSIKKIESTISKAKAAKLDVENKLLKTERDIKKIDNIIAGEIECPECGHLFVLGEQEYNLEELKLEKKELDKVKLEYETSIKNHESDIKKTREKIDKLEESKKEIRLKEISVKTYENSINAERISSSSKNEKIEELRKEYSDLKNTGAKNDERIKALQDKIKKERKEHQEAENQKQIINEEADKLRFWNFHFGEAEKTRKAAFRTYLTNKALKTVEGLTNLNLRQYHTNLSVQIDGYKKLASGEMREKIDVTVFKKGVDFGPFEGLSGGQGSRIDVCGMLTFQKLINASSETGGLNLLALDEKFEGLDMKGQKNCLDILQASNVTTLVVSHLNNDIPFENKMLVHYKNNESKVV